jgi:hypothetical protein
LLANKKEPQGEPTPEHDFHLQITLCCVNGVGFKSEEQPDESIEEEKENSNIRLHKRNEAIANVYFKIEHRDDYGKLIP